MLNNNKTGINMENVKSYNHSSILNLINNFGAMPRKDIASELNLTPAAVTLMCSEMILKGILIEKGEVAEEKRAGRKKVLVDINYEFKYILSISIEAFNTFIAICDLKGTLISLKAIETEKNISPKEFIKKIASKCKDLMWSNNINRDKVLGVGIGITGIVDRDNGISTKAYGIWQEKINIKEIMEEELSLPIIVENNVKAFAEAELIYGRGRKFNNILFLKWGPGVGAALLIEKRIYKGNDKKAAEIGHYIVNPKGEKCKCGRKGCLETIVSYNSIFNKVNEIFSKENTPHLYETLKGNLNSLKGENIDLLFYCKDVKVKEILHNVMECLAQVIVNTITLISPNHVIVFGDILDKDDIIKEFIKYCNDLDSNLTEEYITKSNLSEKIKYIGPSALIYNELFLDNV